MKNLYYDTNTQSKETNMRNSTYHNHMIESMVQGK